MTPLWTRNNLTNFGRSTFAHHSTWTSTDSDPNRSSSWKYRAPYDWLNKSSILNSSYMSLIVASFNHRYIYRSQTFILMLKIYSQLVSDDRSLVLVQCTCYTFQKGVLEVGPALGTKTIANSTTHSRGIGNSSGNISGNPFWYKHLPVLEFPP